MEELCDWLAEQNGGLRTYIEFQKKSLALAQADTGNASIFLLLGGLAGRFATRFEGEPLSVDAAIVAMARLSSLVAEARALAEADTKVRLDFANKVALTDLAEDGAVASPN